MKQGETSLSDAPSLVDDSGTKNWYKKDTTVLHRIGGPAVERADGMREWWEHGERHRLDGPAIEYSDGSREWRANGKLHRSNDRPAIDNVNGRKEWWEHGLRHRINGPALIQVDGSEEWWEHGKRHRSDDKPAIVNADGSREWWENGKKHRIDGPAIEYVGGYQEWWVNHVQIDGSSFTLFQKAISQTTPSSKVGELSHHENNVVAQGAATNPNCPLEDQVEWALMRGEVLGE